jgi:hypothetical protein
LSFCCGVSVCKCIYELKLFLFVIELTFLVCIVLLIAFLQIVSNRARAICYAVRQQQFQLNAELTVNRLVESSQQQLQTLNTLYHGQEQIRSVAENTVAQMELGQKRLAENQEQLERVQADIRIRVVGNLLELRREKELIAAKNRELLGLTEDIRQKLDLTAAGISDQSAVHSARHQELLGDLANLKSRADDVSTKLDKSAAAADSFQRDMIGHHVHALDNLRRINETINYLLTLASGLTDVIDSRSEWLLRITGATDDRMLVLTVVVLHFVYFLAVLFMLAVLRFSFLVRWFLLALVCVNAAAEIKLGKSLTLSELSVAVAVIAVGDLVFLAVRRRWLKGTSKSVVGCGGSANWDGEQHQSLLYADIQHIIKALESLRADICSGHSSSSEPLVDSPVSVAERLDTRLPDVLKNRLDESSFSAGRRSPPPVHRTVFPGMSALTSSPSVSAAYRDLPTGIDTTVTSLTRTHLIRSFAAGSRTPSSRRGGSPAPSDSSYSSTPSKQRPGSRASNLNQSGSRPLCEAFTKTGQPCKLQCQEESKFCYRHQPVSAD